MARLGIDHIVLAKVLNHTVGGITAVYNRYTYDDEKRKALEMWGNYVERLISGTLKPHTVIPLAARRMQI